MQSSVRRAAAFAAVATLALAAPVAGALAAVPFALIAVAGRSVSGGPVFELFARPGDHQARELRGLVGFALAATALALLASLTGLSAGAFAAAVLLLGYGNLAERIACRRHETSIRRVTAFSLGGALTAVAGQAAVATIAAIPVDASTAVFLGVSGGLVGALLREVFPGSDDPFVMVAVAGVLWTFTGIDISVGLVQLGVAVAIAAGFGYTSWYLGTASITGMLTGVIVGLLTIVLGGYGWFAILIAFFGLGGLASKYRYEEKAERGVAEPNKGARGGRNVLGNAAVALLAVVAFAASDRLGIESTVFLYAFTGSVATAMSDTLSSEIGVLFDEPRLITTFEPVRTGTDGAVSVRGSLAGLIGAAVVGLLAVPALDVSVAGAFVIVIAGMAGMFVDSFLGAAVEGRWIGNQGVNFLATLTGAIVGTVGVIVV